MTAARRAAPPERFPADARGIVSGQRAACTRRAREIVAESARALSIFELAERLRLEGFVGLNGGALSGTTIWRWMRGAGDRPPAFREPAPRVLPAKLAAQIGYGDDGRARVVVVRPDADDPGFTQEFYCANSAEAREVALGHLALGACVSVNLAPGRN